MEIAPGCSVSLQCCRETTRLRINRVGSMAKRNEDHVMRVVACEFKHCLGTCKVSRIIAIVNYFALVAVHHFNSDRAD